MMQAKKKTLHGYPNLKKQSKKRFLCYEYKSVALEPQSTLAARNTLGKKKE